jgi:murein DD-endopeptidase MepM/ murein hydrolase activator NlpD
MPHPRLALPFLAAALAALLCAAPARAESTLFAADQSAAPADEGEDEGEDEATWWLEARATSLGLGAPARVLRSATLATRVLTALVQPGQPVPPALLRPMPALTVRPVDGATTSEFGYRRDPIRKRQRRHHNGLDFQARRGTPVRAAGEGLVVKAERYYGYGRVVFVDHGMGVVTRYAHLQSIRVREGQHVPAGAILGTAGSSGRTTGPHLHFEVRVDGRAVDPVRVLGDRLDVEAESWVTRLLELLGEPDQEEEEPPPPRRRRPAS